MPFDPHDPRASLASVASVDRLPEGEEAAGSEYAKFYETEPQEASALARTWLSCGQNFIVAYTEAREGAVLEGPGQPDEYALILPEAATAVAVSLGPEAPRAVGGGSLSFVPPGPSAVRVTAAGRVVRVFSSEAPGLAAHCSNAASYATAHPGVALLAPWPEPVGGFRLRTYSLDVAPEPGRFGRIWRSSNLMINYLDVSHGPRDITKMSPHNHPDFEQGSLVLDGDWCHHIRWQWTPDMNSWRDDEHELCAGPSLTVIPPPAIHTSQAVGAGANQMVDIFSPPRVDFSEKPGWVLNAEEYPMPRG